MNNLPKYDKPYSPITSSDYTSLLANYDEALNIIDDFMEASEKLRLYWDLRILGEKENSDHDNAVKKSRFLCRRLEK